MGASGESFSLASEAPAEAPETSAALQQLTAGQIDLEQYLNVQVEAAVAHLQGSLGASDLALVRDTLREQLASDPALIELAARATGITPTDR